MNQTNTSGETLFSAVHPDIVKQTNVSSLILSACLCVVGISIFAVSYGMDDSSSTLSMLCMTIGTILILLGIFRLFWRSKEWVYLPTKSTIKEGSSFFDEGNLSTIADALRKKDFTSGRNAPMKPGGSVRLDYFLSRDRKFAAVQLFRFIPYTYEPASSIYYYTDNDAAAFVHCLDKGRF